MTPAALDVSKRTVGIVADLLSLGGERLRAAVTALEAGDVGAAAGELDAAATIARQVADASRSFAAELNADSRGVRP